MREPKANVTLFFLSRDALSHVDDPLRRDISASAAAGNSLFTACDETATIEVLKRTTDGSYHQTDNVPLADYFDLPAGPSGEMDIEGLSVDSDFLWVTGSHSRKRDKPDLPKDDNEKALDALADIDRDPNRYFLGRLPLVRDGDGGYQVSKARKRPPKRRSPACIKMKPKGRSKLTKLLHKDRHLAPSVAMPCKENGFDIEGLAVKGDRVFLGLRGPVLSDWAVVIELNVKVPKPGKLKLRRCSAKGRRYLKHFLPLKGLGIRELLFDGDDILGLAGPTMNHDGVGQLFRWRLPAGTENDQVHDPDDVDCLTSLPYVRDRDQAEALAFVPHEGRRHLLIIHDSPSQERLTDNGRGLVADLFDLSGDHGPIE